MKEKNKLIEYLLNTNNPYEIKVNDMVVEIEYLENGKSFTECMVNILLSKGREN